MIRSRGRPAPKWLTARPIAHRGLHDRTRGIIENTTSAALAALGGNYGIEFDVRITADGEAVVFHDFTLERLTEATGPLSALSAAALLDVKMKGTADTIPTLRDFLSLVGGRTPLICEIKSRFDGQTRLAQRVADLVGDYPGPLALKSFDPEVIGYLRNRGCAHPLGIVSEARFCDPDWGDLSPSLKHALANVLHFEETRPDFLSYHVDDLPNGVPFLLRSALNLPVLAWTVRTEDQRVRAATWADQIIFEDLRP